jgi:hypothetical protein
VQCRGPVHRECGALFWKNREMYFSPAREEQIILATASSARAARVISAPRVPGNRYSKDNDVGYLPRLTPASLPWPLRALPRVRARTAGFGDTSALTITEQPVPRAPAGRTGRPQRAGPC